MGRGRGVTLGVDVAVGVGEGVIAGVGVTVGVTVGVPEGVGVGVIGGVGVGEHGGPWHQVMLKVSTRQPSLEPLVSLAIRQRRLPSFCRPHVHHGCNETLRVAAPRPKPSNRATSIGAEVRL